MLFNLTKRKFRKLFRKIERSSNKEQLEYFIKYCDLAIYYENLGKLTKEEASCKIVAGYTPIFGNEAPQIFENIFDHAGDLEIPRESRFNFERGDPWDKDTADRIKEEGWIKLTQLVQEAHDFIDHTN